jgi:hypothetical protein
MNKIVMRTRYESFEIELNDSDTANAVFLALPLTREISTWGGEIYFEVPVEHPLENGKKVLEVGDVAFWPEGSAFCIFFGRTPFSKGKGPEAYGPVTPIGKVVSNIEKLEEMAEKTEIVLDRSF